MSQQPKKQPATKAEEKQHSLPKVQRKIVICLAEEGAKDISEINDSLKGHYKSTNTAVHKLEEEHLLEKVGSKIYKSVSYPRYWLTSYGIFLAMTDEETDLKKLAARIETQKGKNLSSIKPFIGVFKDALPEMKPLLKDVFMPLFKGYNLNQRLTDEQNTALLVAVDNSSEDIKSLFNLFMSIRGKVKFGE